MHIQTFCCFVSVNIIILLSFLCTVVFSVSVGLKFFFGRLLSFITTVSTVNILGVNIIRHHRIRYHILIPVL